MTPTIFTMANQQQPTAEKSVQTHDSSGSTTGFITNNPENAAAEVANTLVSMATGRQRGITTVKPSTSTAQNQSSSSLPILSLADYTTSQGVPTATALANQAKLRPRKQENPIESNQDDLSMSTDEYNQASNDSSSGMKTPRERTNKSNSSSKSKKEQAVQPIQYGPILVKPRKSTAPTLANGRKSKDEVVSMKKTHSISFHIFLLLLFISFRRMKTKNVDNVVIEINKQQLNVVRNEMNFENN